MFKDIFRALRGSNKLSEMIAEIGQMLEAGAWMFDRASEALMKKTDWESMADSLYARDKRINKLEQTVREGIITHLSLGHQADLSACLVLMSVVKDAERIGDYCKNIFEIAKFYRGEYTHPEYAVPLSDIRGATRPLFDRARQAFTDAERPIASDVMSVARKITVQCDQIIRQLLSVQEQLAPDEAVAYVLLARFYKRVAAHLSNIATSVVAPVPLIDFESK